MKQAIFKYCRIALLCLTSLQSSFSFANEKIELRWAADTESGVPYVFQNPKNPNELIGFEKEIIEEIAKTLNQTPVFIQNAWEGLIPGLSRKTYDAVINGIEITNARKNSISFSNPYFTTFEQIVVKRGDTRFTKLSDLKGHTVGTLKFTVAHDLLSTLGDTEILYYEHESLMFSDLAIGRMDAILIDSPIALYYGAENPKLELVGEPIGRVLYGIGLRKEDKVLLADLNRALETLRKNDFLRRLYDRYNLWNPRMAELFNDHRLPLEKPDLYTVLIENKKNHLSFFERFKNRLQLFPLIAKGAIMTLKISVTSMLLAVILGLFLAIGRVFGPKFLSFLIVIFIEVVRGTPLLIQLFFIFYGLPILGLQLSPFVSAVLGLGINYAAYEAENYRAGLQAVPKSQSEAAFALGFNPFQTLRYIVVPQALRIVLPPITNDFISLLKDSSLVSVITIVELTKTYGQLASVNYDYLGIGVMVAAVYLMLGLPFVRLARVIEKNLVSKGPKLRK